MALINPDVVSLSSFQILKIRLYGHARIGYAEKAGWKGKIPLFAFRCKTHGVVNNTPQGHKQWLICPTCFEEETAVTHDLQDQMQLDSVHSTPVGGA